MSEKSLFLLKAKKTAIVLGILALAVAGVVYDVYFEKPPVVEDDATPVTIDAARWGKAPDFTFTDLDGSTHKLSDFQGKIVLIDFWATWCPTCVKEFPAITDFVESQKGDVVLIALSSDSGTEPIRTFITKQSAANQETLKKPFVHIALDEGRQITRDTFMSQMYPETIFVAPDQRMVKKTVGLTGWDTAEMKGFIAAMHALK